MFFRQAAAGGAADLHGLEFRAVLQSAAHVEDDLTQGRTHGDFDQAGVFNGAGEGEGLAAGAAGVPMDLNQSAPCRMILGTLA